MTQAATLPAKAPVKAGAPVLGIVPTDINDVFRLSQAIAMAGMAPRGMEKPEQITYAIMSGMELGLPPIAALHSIALVNNRPTIWGDGLLGVVLARGIQVREWHEDETAFCEVTRPNGQVTTRSFSQEDAKRAGLAGKQGPWTQYTARMRQMRARAFALRDGCADILRGIQVREEVEDYQPAAREVVREVAPAETLRLEAAAPPQEIEIVDLPPTDALQTQSDPELARDGEEGAAASASDHEEPTSLIDRLLTEIQALDGPRAVNDYARAKEGAIATLGASDQTKVKSALQRKRSAG